MKLEAYARELLLGEGIESKLMSSRGLEIEIGAPLLGQVPTSPGRNSKIKFSEERAKFPKTGSFHQIENRARALHFFANHELLAIEMMAAALLVFPTLTDEDVALKHGLVKTIEDEQKHFLLYRKRMLEFGVEFGDFPINDFFWRYMKPSQNFSQFYAVMALTFESANLDFANHYREAFLEVGDDESARIMQTVLEDEIAHVKRGVHWCNRWRGEKSMWDYYIGHLPFPLTPARAKGIGFNQTGRESAGLGPEFILALKEYNDGYRVTQRKNWA